MGHSINSSHSSIKFRLSSGQGQANWNQTFKLITKNPQEMPILFFYDELNDAFLCPCKVYVELSILLKMEMLVQRQYFSNIHSCFQ